MWYTNAADGECKRNMILMDGTLSRSPGPHDFVSVWNITISSVCGAACLFGSEVYVYIIYDIYSIEAK